MYLEHLFLQIVFYNVLLLHNHSNSSSAAMQNTAPLETRKLSGGVTTFGEELMNHGSLQPGKNRTAELQDYFKELLVKQ